MRRREFLVAGGAALLSGLARGGSQNGAEKVAALMRSFVSAKLYRGLACASNHGLLLTDGYRTMAENSDPSGAAQPMGNRVSGNRMEAYQAPGIRSSRIDARL